MGFVSHIRGLARKFGGKALAVAAVGMVFAFGQQAKAVDVDLGVDVAAVITGMATKLGLAVGAAVALTAATIIVMKAVKWLKRAG